MQKELTFRLLVLAVTMLGVCGAVYRPAHDALELENRIPEAAPYVTAEAQFFPPPFEEYWTGSAHPGQCQSCHRRIFEEWSGSMMANAWRDPAWRGAFLLSGASDVDQRRLRRARPTRRHCQGAAQPVRGARRMRLPLRPGERHAARVPAGLARRWLLLALSHAQQLRGQRSVARRHSRSAVGTGARPPCARFQPDL